MQLSRRRLLKNSLKITAATSLLSSGKLAFANKPPITIYVGFPPGGVPDFVARAVSHRLSKLLARPVVVTNRTGAGGQLAIQALINAPTDGTAYTMTTPAAMTVLPHIHSNINYNVDTDLKAVAAVCNYFLALAVTNKVEATNVEEFFDWCRANPKQATCGVPGLGTSIHLVLEDIIRKADVPIEIIPYKGGPELTMAVTSGEVASALNLSNNFTALYKDKKLNLLAVTAPERLPFLPDIPTIGEAGFSGFGTMDWIGLIANKKVPDSEVIEVHAAIEEILADKNFIQEIEQNELIPLPLTTDGFSNLITDTSNFYKKQIDRIGFKMS